MLLFSADDFFPCKSSLRPKLPNENVMMVIITMIITLTHDWDCYRNHGRDPACLLVALRHGLDKSGIINDTFFTDIP